MSTHKDTIDAYNGNAAAYHAHVSNSTDSVYHAFYEKPAIRSLLPDLTNLSILSLGCGSGVDSRYLKDQGAKRVVGIDISPELIEIAKAENKDIDFYVMDMEHLDFPDASFDVCYSSLAIHYLETWTTALTEVRRVLKSGGRYIFSASHPVHSALERFQTEENKGARLGKTVSVGTGVCTVHGDYLGNSGDGILPIDANVNDMQVRTYQRTFSKMIEEITASGLKIERVYEPQPLPELQNIDLSSFDVLTKIPNIIIWSLSKE